MEVLAPVFLSDFGSFNCIVLVSICLLPWVSLEKGVGCKLHTYIYTYMKKFLVWAVPSSSLPGEYLMACLLLSTCCASVWHDYHIHNYLCTFDQMSNCCFIVSVNSLQISCTPWSIFEIHTFHFAIFKKSKTTPLRLFTVHSLKNQESLPVSMLLF